MANSIDLVTVFQPILDEIYQTAALTSLMDSPTKPVDFAGAGAVKIFKTSVVGMGTYSRATGYPAGDITGAWELMTLTAERGRALTVDRQDDDESLGMAFGTVISEYMRTQVVPEIDAYRFSRYASWSGIQEVASPATLSKTTILDAIDAGSAKLDDENVPAEDRILFISFSCYRFLNAAITRMLANERAADRRLQMLDELTVVPVPQGRFYKGITLNAGATGSAGGFAKTSVTGRDINFMIAHKGAVLQAVKQDALKIFDPETNQTTDGWLIQHRAYHDAWVYDNKVKGIYSHIKGS
jgi:hypothetical protein